MSTILYLLLFRIGMKLITEFITNEEKKSKSIDYDDSFNIEELVCSDLNKER